MAINILNQPLPNLKAGEQALPPNGLLDVEQRLAAAHQLAHQLLDKGSFSRLSTQAYEQVGMLIRHVDQSYQEVHRLVGFLSGSLQRRKQ